MTKQLEIRFVPSSMLQRGARRIVVAATMAVVLVAGATDARIKPHRA